MGILVARTMAQSLAVAAGVFRRKLGAVEPSPDLNGDGTVGITDIMLVAIHWGKTNADGLASHATGWDPRYDLDGDADVDIADIMLVVNHWGETC